MAGYAHNPLVLIYSLKRGYTLNIAMYSESLVFNGKFAEIYNNITLMSFMNYIILENFAEIPDSERYLKRDLYFHTPIII